MLRLKLKDRRQGGRPLVYWVFQRHLEAILYGRDGSGGSSGAIWKLVSQTGLGRTSFLVNKAAVTLKQVSQAEFDEMLAAFKHSLPYADPTTINRTHSFTLVPVATAAAVARTFGRAEESIVLLRALSQPVPEAWLLHAEQEQNEQRGEVDLQMGQEIEDAGFEAEELDFAEELTTMAAFEPVKEDEARMTQYTLAPIPTVLARELETFIAYRTSTFQAKRAGCAVVSLSAEGDKKALLRFFGWMKHIDRVPDGAFLHITLLMRADLADAVTDFVTFLRDRQKLKYSSIANYLSGIVSVMTYVYTTHQLPEETVAMEPSPLSMVINLRGQAEKASKQETAYSKRVGGWLSWEQVQRGRVKAMSNLSGCSNDPKERRTLLREAAAISLLSLIPPDRVGASSEIQTRNLPVSILLLGRLTVRTSPQVSCASSASAAPSSAPRAAAGRST